MSSLWTPGGEHEVPRPSADDHGESAGDLADELPPLTEEEAAELAEAAEQVGRIRAQLAAAPPEVVVANHVMGLYELAAVHLNREDPDLAAARLAIDALGAVLDVTKGRLGEVEETLTGARTQLQLAFVQVSQWVQQGASGA